MEAILYNYIYVKARRKSVTFDVSFSSLLFVYVLVVRCGLTGHS